MSFRLFGCTKYRRLSNERFDRDLSLAEREFMAKHRSVCAGCRVTESQGNTALNMLRLAAMEPEFDVVDKPHFEERILRRLRVQATRESVRYWSPAFFGAAIAGLSVLAALQLVSAQPTVSPNLHPDGSAYRTRIERLPAFDLNEIQRMR